MEKLVWYARICCLWTVFKISFHFIFCFRRQLTSRQYVMFWNSVLYASGATVGLIFLFYGSLSITTVKNSVCSVLDRLTQRTLAGVLLSNTDPHKRFCECCFWQSCARLKDDFKQTTHKTFDMLLDSSVTALMFLQMKWAVNLTSPELILSSGCPET